MALIDDLNTAAATTKSAMTSLGTVAGYLAANPPSDPTVTAALGLLTSNLTATAAAINQAQMDAPTQQPQPLISSTGLAIAGLLVLVGGGIWLWSASQKKKTVAAAPNPAPKLNPRPASRAKPKAHATKGLVQHRRRRKAA